ncbi:hypothetical protein GIB67_020143 [Kingdonia uniflora]|uniref:Uncharacterized protein n=1 Tax=Kingdonia uniflora TaxID=39325 RepID=A0A7J7NIV9_9MAGN|nr:hypothetical protein GIB67_020143 [Kingdonia uniflora]
MHKSDRENPVMLLIPSEDILCRVSAKGDGGDDVRNIFVENIVDQMRLPSTAGRPDEIGNSSERAIEGGWASWTPVRYAWDPWFHPAVDARSITDVPSKLRPDALALPEVICVSLTPELPEPGSKLSLFDRHCHLQDPRIRHVYPQLIQIALDSRLLCFGVNKVSEKDWKVEKQMSEEYLNSVIPYFGLHPWYVGEKFNILRGYIDSTPSAVGEIGLDKGSHGKEIDFVQQILVFQKQLQLAKDLHRPASIHCVRAFADLLQIM